VAKLPQPTKPPVVKGGTGTVDPTAIVNLALLGLDAILKIIAQVKSQGGMTDDQILAQAQQLTSANDALYNTLIATLDAAGPASPAAPAK
jgi:hypothetical protein